MKLSKRYKNKYTEILVRTLEGDSKLAKEMLAAHPEWVGLPNYIREMKAIANITHEDKNELFDVMTENRNSRLSNKLFYKVDLSTSHKIPYSLIYQL